MYFAGGSNAIALNADSGTEVWKFPLSQAATGGAIRRGMTYWPGTPQHAPRLLVTMSGGKLVQLDAKSGRLVPEVGVIDLVNGIMDRIPDGEAYAIASPVAVYKNLAIFPGRTGEHNRWGIPGDLRAFDLLTGKQVWRFHTVPHPGDPNFGTTPRIVGSAYTNNFSGATTTTLYDIDSNLDILATQNPPNNGTLNTVGALGMNTSDLVGFDISGLTGTAFASLAAPGAASSSLFTVNLATGAGTLVGTIGASVALLDIAVTAAVPEPSITISTTLGLAVLAFALRRRRISVRRSEPEPISPLAC